MTEEEIFITNFKKETIGQSAKFFLFIVPARIYAWLRFFHYRGAVDSLV